jgi:cytochrome c oxidase subunit IV
MTTELRQRKQGKGKWWTIIILLLIVAGFYIASFMVLHD